MCGTRPIEAEITLAIVRLSTMCPTRYSLCSESQQRLGRNGVEPAAAERLRSIATGARAGDCGALLGNELDAEAL